MTTKEGIVKDLVYCAISEIKNPNTKDSDRTKLRFLNNFSILIRIFLRIILNYNRDCYFNLRVLE